MAWSKSILTFDILAVETLSTNKRGCILTNIPLCASPY